MFAVRIKSDILIITLSLSLSASVSGGSVLEEGGEGSQRGDRGADQACERAGEQALNYRSVTKLIFQRNKSRAEVQKKKRNWERSKETRFH